VPEPHAPPIPLYRREEGTGPQILLLHGLGGDHSVWDAQVPELAKEFHVVAPDLRGHGRSESPAASTYSFAEFEGDLGTLLDSTGAAPAHVVGLSAGGFLAMRLALDAPARVRSLTLIGSSVHCDNHTKAVSQRWAETYRDEGFDAYLLRLVKDLYYPDFVEAHPEVLERLRAQQSQQNLAAALSWATAVRSFDLRGRLARISQPTRVLQGMDDGVVDGSHGRLLRVSIPGAELKLFAQTGHLVPIERPSETTDAIREFARDVERRGPAPS
jgi:3-oxoadipate enol-lactonase